MSFKGFYHMNCPILKNRYILIGSIVATLAGVIMMLASFARWAAILGGFGRDEKMAMVF